MTSTHSKLLNQQIDQYRIASHIARGGMADVYLAEDVDLERKVAFKVMLDSLAATDAQFTERFHREAKVVARLNHPNIVQIYTIGQTPVERPYIAMQYIEGGSLQEKLKELADRRKLLTTEQALNIVRQIALALDAAHRAGIVHRDLKPANVLIRPDGTPVLVDLGIATIKGGAKLTQTGGIIGTPAYMSPEQVRGQPLNGRSDLYALGIMLYEILAGVRPFEADESVAILHKQVYEEPLPLEKLRPNLPAELLTVVRTALQKDPAHRYQSAAEMVQAIDQAIQAEGLFGPNPQATIVLTEMNDSALLSRSRIVQSPPTKIKQAERRKVQLPMPIWAIVLMLLLVIAPLLFFAFRSVTTTKLSVVSGVTATATTAKLIPTISSSATPMTPTSTIVTIATLVPTVIALPSSMVTIPDIFPNSLIAYSCESSNGSQIYFNTPDGDNQFLLNNQPNNSTVPAFSPDGQQIVYRSNTTGLWQIYASNINGSNWQQVTTGNDNNYEASWSPDGNQFVFVSDRDGTKQIYIMNRDGSNQRRITLSVR